jgi:hypothetical protein
MHLIEGIPTGQQISMLQFNSAGSARDREQVESTRSCLSLPAALEPQNSSPILHVAF